jgi:hypothetical protein
VVGGVGGGGVVGVAVAVVVVVVAVAVVVVVVVVAEAVVAVVGSTARFSFKAIEHVFHSNSTRFKILLGWGPGNILDMAQWAGPDSPNATSSDFGNFTQVCGRTPETGCLYNVWEDPGEHNNLAVNQPDLFNR